MKLKLTLLVCITTVLLCMSVLALGFNDPTLPNLDKPKTTSTSSQVNYSSINVNNSQFLQGLTPSQVANLYSNPLIYNYSIIDQAWVLAQGFITNVSGFVNRSGDIINGSLDMNNNNLTNAQYLQSEKIKVGDGLLDSSKSPIGMASSNYLPSDSNFIEMRYDAPFGDDGSGSHTILYQCFSPTAPATSSIVHGDKLGINSPSIDRGHNNTYVGVELRSDNQGNGDITEEGGFTSGTTQTYIAGEFISDISSDIASGIPSNINQIGGFFNNPSLSYQQGGYTGNNKALSAYFEGRTMIGNNAPLIFGGSASSTKDGDIIYGTTNLTYNGTDFVLDQSESSMFIIKSNVSAPNLCYTTGNCGSSGLSSQWLNNTDTMYINSSFPQTLNVTNVTADRLTSSGGFIYNENGIGYNITELNSTPVSSGSLPFLINTTNYVTINSSYPQSLNLTGNLTVSGGIVEPYSLSSFTATSSNIKIGINRTQGSASTRGLFNAMIFGEQYGRLVFASDNPTKFGGYLFYDADIIVGSPGKGLVSPSSGDYRSSVAVSQKHGTSSAASYSLANVMSGGDYGTIKRSNEFILMTGSQLGNGVDWNTAFSLDPALLIPSQNLRTDEYMRFDFNETARWYSTRNITLNPNSTVVINGSAVIKGNSTLNGLTLESDGSSWYFYNSTGSRVMMLNQTGDLAVRGIVQTGVAL